MNFYCFYSGNYFQFSSVSKPELTHSSSSSSLSEKTANSLCCSRQIFPNADPTCHLPPNTRDCWKSVILPPPLPPQETLENIYPGDPILALKFHKRCHKRTWYLTHLDGAELSFPGAQANFASACWQRCWTPCIPLTLLRTRSLQAAVTDSQKGDVRWSFWQWLRT